MRGGIARGENGLAAATDVVPRLAAIETGEFDQLRDFGRTSAICDESYDPHWWIRRKLKREQLRGVLAYSHDFAIIERGGGVNFGDPWTSRLIPHEMIATTRMKAWIARCCAKILS